MSFLPPWVFFPWMGNPTKIFRGRRIEKLTRNLEFRTIELRASFNRITQSNWANAYLAWISSPEVSHYHNDLVTIVRDELGGKIVLHACVREAQGGPNEKDLVNKALDAISSELHRALAEMRLLEEKVGL